MGAEIAGAIANAQLYDERRRAEEEAQRLARENAVIAEIGRIVSSSVAIGGVYPRFAEQVRELVDFETMHINLLDADESLIKHAYHMGTDVPGRRPGDVYPMAGTAFEQIYQARSGKIFHLIDTEQVAAEVPGLLPAFELGVRSFVAAPLVHRDRAIGGFFLSTTKPNAYGEQDRVLTERVGAQIAGAVANAELYAELLDAQDTLSEMAVLEERNRMAREIHDTMAQGFTGIVLQLEAAEQVFDDEPQEVPGHLVRAKDLARECLGEARRSVWNLLPRALEQLPLTDALQQAVDEFASVGREKAQLRVIGDARELAAEVQAALLRICQESLINVQRHAQATEAVVRLEFQPGQVSLEVCDDGVGFDRAATRARAEGGGFGLTSMEQRARLMSGRLEVRSAKGEGTRVRVIIPIA